MAVYIFIFFWILAVLFSLYAVIKGFPAMVSVGPIPAHKKGIAKALELADIKPNEIFYDLGCGDGRVVADAVKKYGCYGVGYELVLPYCLLARLRAKISGIGNKTEFRCENIFSSDIENADVIFCFLTPKLMEKVGEYASKKKLKNRARIISYAFSIKNRMPQKVIGPEKGMWKIYLYTTNNQ